MKQDYKGKYTGLTLLPKNNHLAIAQQITIANGSPEIEHKGNKLSGELWIILFVLIMSAMLVLCFISFHVRYKPHKSARIYFTCIDVSYPIRWRHRLAILCFPRQTSARLERTDTVLEKGKYMIH